MTKDEYIRFISEGTRTGKLATVNKNGSPHVVPIWFLFDGENLGELFQIESEGAE